MKARCVVAALLSSVAATSVVAQGTPELLRPVDPVQALRLEEYNRAFILDRTFFAARYRIVQVDTSLLLAERDITITPFNDMEPIELVWQETRVDGPDGVIWIGRYEDDPLFELLGPPGNQVKINLHAWDLDVDGSAVNSARNRFEFSPAWRIDANGRPELRSGEEADSGIALGPPPQTPEQIERHRRLLQLQKHAFYSATATFDRPGGNQFVLAPLRFTPRYSVVYELVRGTVPRRSDRPEEPEYRSEADRVRAERYRRFHDSLPNEEGKAVRGDLP